MSQTIWMAAAGAAWLAATVPLLAHHQLYVEYDPKGVLTLRGPITTVEWTNPHTFMHIAVTTPDGKTETWRVEGGSPVEMARRKISREMIAVGAVVTIVGYRAKDHSTKAWGRDITFPDGRTLYMGSYQRPPSIGPQPTAPPWLLPAYVLAVPGVVLAVGLVILWRRRPEKRRRDEADKEAASDSRRDGDEDRK